MSEVGTASYRTEKNGKINDRNWIYRLVGYGFSGSDTLADDRAWNKQGWGIAPFDTVWHYYPPYHKDSACCTITIAPTRCGYRGRGGFGITRPEKLYKKPGIRKHSLRHYSQCRTCLNLKRIVEGKVTKSAEGEVRA